MNKTAKTLTFITFLLAPLLPMAGAETVEEIINRARAHLGADQALERVTSIKFVGTLEDADGTTGRVEILFQKPLQQRITLHVNDMREITALDGYDGWRRVEEVGNESNWQLTLLEPQQIRRLQANTWENLSFYRGLERRGGRVEYEGRVTVDGRECHKVTFVHSPRIAFTRYFDVATGGLVMTETESGGQIREEGELRVEGIRFPRRVITSVDGNRSVITFEQVVVNERFPRERFAVPLLVPQAR
ncbi:MAG: hypothetical protein EA425_13025 [Puniceicoccaceae bacterium]|nr:MAG: hypothetical protein EA425_13025 [Puniceicoccaceae bacterium]